MNCEEIHSYRDVMVQDFNSGQMCVSGFNSHYEFVLGAGARAKTATNNLPLLSVLCKVVLLIFIV
jgi:hypothetical protein